VVLGHTVSIYLCKTHPQKFLQKLTVSQLVNKFPAFCGTRRFITVCARACHWSLFWARWL